MDFDGGGAVIARPQSSIICDAPVAPVRLRIEAAAIDTAIIAVGCTFALLPFLLAHAPLFLDRHRLPFFALAVLPVPLLYKLLWTFVGRDTTGMRCAGLRLIDFDGNPPSRSSRYQR
ncbi:MAG: RDD family protein, partial [Acidobacteriales bacterium]|nr:RDD family protein [Terriglobales bacterium]